MRGRGRRGPVPFVERKERKEKEECPGIELGNRREGKIGKKERNNRKEM
jgi:hypothetical protein